MFRSIAIAALLVTACKADKPAEPAATPEPSPAAVAAPPARDGKIDLVGKRDPREQPVLGANSRAHELVAQRRRERMAKLDTDGDGVISDAEREAMRKKRAEDMRNRLDLDHDGKVTREELAKSTFRMFDSDKVDANNDGNITLEEIEAAMAERAKAWGAGRHKFGVGSAAGSGAVPTP